MKTLKKSFMLMNLWIAMWVIPQKIFEMEKFVHNID